MTLQLSKMDDATPTQQTFVFQQAEHLQLEVSKLDEEIAILHQTLDQEPSGAEEQLLKLRKKITSLQNQKHAALSQWLQLQPLMAKTKAQPSSASSEKTRMAFKQLQDELRHFDGIISYPWTTAVDSKDVDITTLLLLLEDLQTKYARTVMSTFEDRIMVLGFACKGRAASTFSELQQQADYMELSTDEEKLKFLEARLRQAFQPHDLVAQTFAQICRFKMEASEDFNSYVTRFKRQLRYLPQTHVLLSDAPKLEAAAVLFREGFNPSIKAHWVAIETAQISAGAGAESLTAPPVSFGLEETIISLRKALARGSGAGVQVPSMTASAFTPRPPAQHHYKMRNSSSKNSGHRPKPYQRPIVCYHCKTHGHMFFECPDWETMPDSLMTPQGKVLTNVHSKVNDRRLLEGKKQLHWSKGHRESRRDNEERCRSDRYRRDRRSPSPSGSPPRGRSSYHKSTVQSRLGVPPEAEGRYQRGGSGDC